jgi:DNA-binding NtrC family response regulator
VRVVAATNCRLRQLVDEGRFKEDLYYRLHVVPIDVPPLRERAEDIPMLAEHFVDKHAKRNGKSIVPLEDGMIAALQAHHWPGNVRELENTIERAVVLSAGPAIARDAVSFDTATTARPGVVPSLKLRQNIEWMERETLRRALELSPSKRDAARMMGITPRALSYYLAKYPVSGRPQGGPRSGPPEPARV